MLKVSAANPTLVMISQEFQLPIMRLVWLYCTQCVKFMEENLAIVCEWKYCWNNYLWCYKLHTIC